MLTMIKIARNGNAATVCIPRKVLEHTGWLPGDHVVMVVNEDHTITLQRITRENLRAAAQMCLLQEQQEAVAP